MKHIKFMLFCLLSVCLCFASVSASALTSAEKEEMYGAAVLEFETYLENPGKSDSELLGIINSFEELGGYEQSIFLSYYANVLYKIQAGDFDQILLVYLDMLDNKAFNEYLNNNLKESSIRPVNELKAYAQARELENTGKIEDAMKSYKECLPFYDASHRYFDLLNNQYKVTYDFAKELLNNKDYVGAYYQFKSIAKYKDSENYLSSIVKLLGYTPSSSTDTLQPVKNLKVKRADVDRITIEWTASSHATSYVVSYRAETSNDWIFFKETSDTTSTIDGLNEGRSYDIRVVAKSGAIESNDSLISTKTVIPTPTPSPTPNPTATPAPKLTNCSVETEAFGDVLGLRVKWDGGVSPYTIYLYQYKNDKLDLGKEEELDHNTEKKNKQTYFYKLLVSDQSYWIKIKDNSGQELWYEYTFPKISFDAFKVKINYTAIEGRAMGPNGYKGRTLSQNELSISNKTFKQYYNGEVSGEWSNAEILVKISGNHADLYPTNVDPGWQFAFILPDGKTLLGVLECSRYTTGNENYIELDCIAMRGGQRWSFINCIANLYGGLEQIPLGKCSLIITYNNYYVGTQTVTIKK